MLKINIILVFVIIGLCAAATTPKPKNNNKSKEAKEKRESAVSSGPYSYNTPQKSFAETAQHQQKVAPIEYHQKQPQQIQYYEVPQKQEYHAAPQTFYQQKPQVQHFEHESIRYSFPSVIENYDAPSKGGEYGFNYPGFESFQHMPVEQYNAELDKINQALVSLGNYKLTPSGYKSQIPHDSYSFDEFQQTYSPQNQQNFVSHSAPSAPDAGHHGFGFVQSPAALFVPQSVSINPKSVKTPDYASGVKGLGHFSTVSAVPVAPEPAPTAYKLQSYEAASYKPQSYDVASYKPTSYDVASYKPTSYVVPAYKPQSYQSISYKPTHSYKPQAYEVHYKQQAYEAPVSHLYNQYTQTERPFKASTYLGSSPVDSHSEQSIASHKPSAEYLPPSKTYLPAKEPVKTYLPAREPAKTYLPAKEQYASAPTMPGKEQYSPEHTQVEYQIQYVQVPTKSYLPPTSNSYSPSKSPQEPPKSSYLPPASPAPPKKQYLPASQPTTSYLPPSQPTASYLPPNNPYQSSYHTSSSHPQNYQQHFKSEGSYESHEYQSAGTSGHK